ncbi:STAS domain-containing protein [Streptomyces sp. NPDC050504]|uniref:STAS domain-containing protein n=1 Tax=Streptomyces sp. NPDC050504 TaxID=3365618 RepID=UPI0037895F6B
MPMPVSLPVYHLAGNQIITMYEILDLANAPRVSDELEGLVTNGREPAVVLDVRTSFLTSTGVAVLEHAGAVAARRRRRLRVAARRPLARRVLALTGADQALDVHPDLPSALYRP